MRKIKILVVEDNIQIRNEIIEITNNHLSNCEIIGEASSVKSGLKLIEQHSPDILFLDVELEDGNGFQLLEQTSKTDLKVIFITAHEQFALDAFRVNAVDYLLKPIKVEDLIEVQKRVQSNQTTISDLNIESIIKNYLIHDKFVTIGTLNGFEVVQVSDIIYCAAEGSKTRFYLTDDTELVSSRKLKEFESEFIELGFLRIHHSYIINVRYIKAYDRHDSCIIMTNLDEVPIAQRRRKMFLDFMKA